MSMLIWPSRISIHGSTKCTNLQFPKTSHDTSTSQEMFITLSTSLISAGNRLTTIQFTRQLLTILHFHLTASRHLTQNPWITMESIHHMSLIYRFLLSCIKNCFESSIFLLKFPFLHYSHQLTSCLSMMPTPSLVPSSHLLLPKFPFSFSTHVPHSTDYY